MKQTVAVVLFSLPVLMWAPMSHGNTVSEAEAAEILLTINEGEIDAGQLARRRAQNGEVKEFAKKMVDQHKASEKETKKIARRTKIDPKESAASEALEDEVESKHDELKKQEKNAFDKAYMRNQIAMHENALATLDNTLIPSAQNAEFKEHLRKTRQAVKEHLDHAKALDAKIQ